MSQSRNLSKSPEHFFHLFQRTFGWQKTDKIKTVWNFSEIINWFKMENKTRMPVKIEIQMNFKRNKKNQ